MRAYARKRDRPQRQASSNLARSHTEPPAPHPRVEVVLQLQRTIGNQAVGRLLQGEATKLAISLPRDETEQEADRIADRLMATPAGAAVGGAPPPVQHVSSQSGGRIDEGAAGVDRVLASSGRPLHTAVRHEMEARFGHDFSRVRVHSGAAAEQSAENLSAYAYTVGHDMVFGAGQFAPETRQGRRLIAHELAHVVQQQASQASIQRQPRGQLSAPPDPVDEQTDVVHESFLPLELYRRPEIRKLSFSERQVLLFQRKLQAIFKLGDLGNRRAVWTLIAVLEDRVFGIKPFSPRQKLILQEAAAEALGKIGGTAALSKLNDLLTSKDPKDRLRAARGLSEASGSQAVASLLAALRKEADADTKARIIFALGNVGSRLSSDQEKELVAKELIREMESSGGDVQLAAINALGKLRRKSATEPLLKQIRQHLSIEPLVQDAIRSLGEIGDDRAVELLVILLKDHGKTSVRSEAALALGKIRGSKALAALKRRLNQETDAGVKANIAKAIRGPGVMHLHWKFQPSSGSPEPAAVPAGDEPGGAGAGTDRRRA